jgi:EAL domain-containing protein (putative c-di-GMP-specific phosphodiesterase class I)/DNA-binding NarL/FixJ family response regulator
MRVLVFDDDDAIGRLVARVATMSGMDATAVTDAGAFLQSLSDDPPQVVVLDLQLQGTDGVEQMRHLADRQYAGTLVLMSGYDSRVLGTARSVGKSLGLKVECVLEKPLRVSQLEEVFGHLQAAGESLSIERLLTAIANDELLLNFQPVVTRTPKALRKLEALVRWDHPELGRIPPNDFLPMAESNVAAMDALTDWVVGAAAEAYQVLLQLGVGVPVAVNISTQNLHDLTLPDRLEQRLRAGSMPAEHLCLEITESAVFKDVGRTMDILSRMRLKGMQLSIDDFGIGYSSLKMLRQMPFSEIKIDQSFVADMTTSRDSRAIVKSIIDLAHNMDMGCVAEGVETEETALLLEQLGVTHLQGYLIARPMLIEEVPVWLAAWTGSAPKPLPALTIAIQDPASLPDDAPIVPSAPTRPKADGSVIQLSPRQIEVMQLLSEGCPVKEIAYQLNLGISTIKVHLSLAYSALGAHNRIEAIRRAAPFLIVR